MKDRGYLSWVAPISVGVLAVALWHVLVKAFNVPHYLVPSPALVVQTLIADWGLLFGSLLITLKITFGAFFMAVLVGTVVAFLFVQSRWVEVSLFPYAVLLQVTLVRPPREALLVPEIAIVQIGNASFVYRIGEDGSAQRADIQVGGRREGKAEVLSGLAPGDRIVVDGVGKLRPGQKVEIVATGEDATEAHGSTADG